MRPARALGVARVDFDRAASASGKARPGVRSAAAAAAGRRAGALDPGRHLRAGDAAARGCCTRWRRWASPWSTPPARSSAASTSRRRASSSATPGCRPRRPGRSKRSPRPQAIVAARAAAGGHPLVLKPLFGAQGRGLRLLRRAGRAAGAGGGRRRLLPATVRPAADGAAGATSGSSWWAGRAGGGMMRGVLQLDHQYRPGRHARSRPEPTGGGGAGRRRGRRRRRRPCRRRPDRGRDGSLLILEVNSMPAWQGLQSVAEVDIAACSGGAAGGRLRGRHRVSGLHCGGDRSRLSGRLPGRAGGAEAGQRAHATRPATA